MHYAISMKVLGQTHMWNTQNKRSNFLKIFQLFMGFWIFWTHSKTEHETKHNKNKSKAKTLKKKHDKNISKWYKSKQACKDAWANVPKYQKN